MMINALKDIWIVQGSQASHMDEAQGVDEQRTELYLSYSEGAAQAATQRFAMSASFEPSSAWMDAGAVRRLG